MSDRNTNMEEALRTHPCYNEEAHHHFARMHLPVAPKCNIQCNYCNRKYDCTNESRPGVTSEVLTPIQALEKVRYVKERIPELKVVAVAGPGDPLANEETFQAMEMISKEFPELTLCLSTNGLFLPENVDRLWDLGVRFVTVTVNAVDPEVSERIYEFVNPGTGKLVGREAAEKLLEKQMEGISLCVKKGFLVKINVVLIPGVNDKHIPDAVKEFKRLGVFIVNILPLIPVEGTKFENMRAPTAKERRELQDLCANDVRMMRHCKQCRADAIGLLGHDRSQEFTACGSGCGPTGGAKPIQIPTCDKKVLRIAVASEGGDDVDRGFGNSRVFRIYEVEGNEVRLSQVMEMNRDDNAPLTGEAHRLRLEYTVKELSCNDAVIVTGIGSKARTDLEAEGILVVQSREPIEKAVLEAASSLRR